MPLAGEPGARARPAVLESWRRRTASGAVLTSMALGLRQALDDAGERDPVVVVAPGDPPGPPPAVELHLDLRRQDAWVVVRPWLLATGE